MSSEERPSDRLLPDWSRSQWALLFIVPLLLYAAQALDLHPQLRLLRAQPWHATNAEGAPAYRAVIDGVGVSGVANNLSGLAWDPVRGHLWAVVNEPCELLALDRRGSVLARYPLVGFDDVEAVAWIGDGLLLLAEERQQSLVATAVPSVAGPIERGAQRALTLALDPSGNDGIEGLGYDPASDRLFVVKERSPRRLYEIRGLRGSLAGEFALAVADRSEWIRDKAMAADLASVEFDPRTGNLLLLSEASRLVLELDGRGAVMSQHSLRGGSSGLAQGVPQAEGIAIDDEGRIYVVSEPNLFYAFARD